MSSQLDKIESHLEEHGAISNFYAIQRKLSVRLAARINDLKNKRGWDFHVVERKDKNTVYVALNYPEGKQPLTEAAQERHRLALVRNFN